MATLSNTGVLRKSAGAGATTVGWRVALEGGGTVDAQVGTLQLNAGGTLAAGTTTFAGGGAVAFTGTILVNGNLSMTAGSTFHSGR